MRTPRLVVTGLGVISPLGLNEPDFRRNLFAGQCGLERVTFPWRGEDISFPAAPVQNFAPEQWLDPKKIPLMDRVAQMAAAAATQAVADAGIDLADNERSSQTGVIIGTGVGGQNTQEESYTRLLDPKGSGRVHPFTIPRLMVNAAASHVSMTTGARGPSFTVASACASSLHAFGVAMAMLRGGMARTIITGGAESCLTLGTLRGWEALRVMAPDLCKPFSADRNGMVIGEGAAMFVLEHAEDALARGAKIYGEIAGFGMSADAKDLTTPDVEGAARAMRLALDDAHLSPTDIDHVNAHGTGTRINDQTETAALHHVFGAHAPRLAISANKSQFGHALGAAGALEMLATLATVHDDIVPPTLNHTSGDAGCDLNYTPNTARSMPVHAALNNSFAFGGLNAVIAVKKWKA